jgi:hypothetical protein
MHRAWDGIQPLGLPLGAALVDAFDTVGLFSVFSTPWFLVLMTVLTISIVCCTLDRTPRLWRTAHDVRVEQPAAFFDPTGAPGGPGTGDGRDAAPSARCRRGTGTRHFRRRRAGGTETATFVCGEETRSWPPLPRASSSSSSGERSRSLQASRRWSSWARTTAPVRPIRTPGNLLIKNHDFASPRRADGSFADFSTDLSVFRDGRRWPWNHPRERPADRRCSVFHQNTFGPACDSRHPRCRGEARLDGPLLLDDELLDRPQRGFRPSRRPKVGLVAVLSEGRGTAQLVMQGIGPANRNGDDPLPSGV